jgi:hypothetical protein
VKNLAGLITKLKEKYMQDFDAPGTPVRKFWNRTLEDKVYDTDIDSLVSEKSWMRP